MKTFFMALFLLALASCGKRVDITPLPSDSPSPDVSVSGSPVQCPGGQCPNQTGPSAGPTKY